MLGKLRTYPKSIVVKFEKCKTINKAKGSNERRDSNSSQSEQNKDI